MTAWTYTFHLRKNVTFHNGSPMTSEDVIYTYENLSGLNGEKAISSKFSSITNLEAPRRLYRGYDALRCECGLPAV